ncbi:MAG: HlyD family efflux transporter periplasmic adaptor subunit, partial [Pseudomonadota bacterium]
VLAAIEQEEAALERIDERIARLVLRAPTRGLVKGLSVNTIGAVIQPGQALMDLVPLGPALEAVVQIDPRDIGHIRVGQPVNIKVTSFDFARYGAVPGHITQISATTFKTDEGRTYFKARVDLSKNYVARTEHHIIPGMTVLADIVTGEKTILQYLIKPIHLSIQSALTER